MRWYLYFFLLSCLFIKSSDSDHMRIDASDNAAAYFIHNEIKNAQVKSVRRNAHLACVPYQDQYPLQVAVWRAYNKYNRRVSQRQIKIIKILCKAKASVHQRTDTYPSPLAIACNHNNETLMQLLNLMAQNEETIVEQRKKIVHPDEQANL